MEMKELEVYWYDFVCFGIVGISFFGALWVIWKKEGSSSSWEDTTMYESLLVTPSSDCEVFVRALPKGHISTSQLWTSCWKGVHPKWLLITRFVSFLALLGFLVWDVVEWDTTIFVYYTEWTFTLVIVYFGLGTIVSAYGCWLYSKGTPSENGAKTEFSTVDWEENRTTPTYTFRGREFKQSIKLQSHYAQEEIQQKTGFWGYLMQVAYQTCAGAVILTDIVFWGVIVPFISSDSHFDLNVLMGCMHTLNAVFLLVDTSLNSLPFPWFRLSYFVLWSCVYIIFQWVIHACGFSWWPYPFLELNVPWAPLWYFCLALVHLPCYGLYAAIVRVKYTTLPKLFPEAFVRSY